MSAGEFREAVLISGHSESQPAGWQPVQSLVDPNFHPNEIDSKYGLKCGDVPTKHPQSGYLRLIGDLPQFLNATRCWKATLGSAFLKLEAKSEFLEIHIDRIGDPS